MLATTSSRTIPTLRQVTSALVAALLAACTTIPREPILFDGLGKHTFPVSTSDSLAQRWFDQGFDLCMAFNHEEGIRAFDQALRRDPTLAMAHWGKAYALGPNYNDWNEGPERAQRALEELALARGLQRGATELERDLIAALSTRFSMPWPQQRSELNQAYSNAMRGVYRKYPDQPETGFLLADALMNQYPWDQWTADGAPKRCTQEILTVLERVLALDPLHPGANHLYIHALEASTEPQRAEAAADRLRDLMPAAGHLLHMPSHIYMRVGRYVDATTANRSAVRADRNYFAQTGRQQSTDDYHGYHMHNHRFLVWSLMFQGRYEDALRQCDDMIADMPEALQGGQNMADEFAARYHVMLRFGRWEEILQSVPPPHRQPFAMAMWHYARGVAFANTCQADAARHEAVEFEAAAAKMPPHQMIHVVPAVDVLEIARNMLAGETAYKAGKLQDGFIALRAAVTAETKLRYTEPSPWMMPSRHALGALLLEQGKLAAAEQCYREDLARYPHNGWALHGLAECLERRGATKEAVATRAEFQRAWGNATVKIPGSCFCRTH